MSLYADYVNEVGGGREIFEVDGKAFISYFIHKNDGELFIEDFYIKPEFRGSEMVKTLLEKIDITAREYGLLHITFCVLKSHSFLSKMLGRATRYGYHLAGDNETEIYFIKEVVHG